MIDPQKDSLCDMLNMTEKGIWIISQSTTYNLPESECDVN